MNKDLEFLDYIYQNAEMGVVGINHIINRVDSEALEKLILEQREEYENILEEAKNIYKKFGKDEKEISKMAKISSNMYADMKMLTNKDSNNVITRMMIEGSNKGIMEITEKLNHFENCDQEIKALAEKLLATEQQNLDELKKYL